MCWRRRVQNLPEISLHFDVFKPLHIFVGLIVFRVKTCAFVFHALQMMCFVNTKPFSLCIVVEEVFLSVVRLLVSSLAHSPSFLALFNLSDDIL